MSLKEVSNSKRPILDKIQNGIAEVAQGKFKGCMTVVALIKKTNVMGSKGSPILFFTVSQFVKQIDSYSEIISLDDMQEKMFTAKLCIEYKLASQNYTNALKRVFTKHRLNQIRELKQVKELIWRKGYWLNKFAISLILRGASYYPLKRGPSLPKLVKQKKLVYIGRILRKLAIIEGVIKSFGRRDISFEKSFSRRVLLNLPLEY